MDIFNIILLAIGVLFIIGSLIMNTKSVTSAIIFKVIPFFSGAYCIFYALRLSSLI